MPSGQGFWPLHAMQVRHLANRPLLHPLLMGAARVESSKQVRTRDIVEHGH